MSLKYLTNFDYFAASGKVRMGDSDGIALGYRVIGSSYGSEGSTTFRCVELGAGDNVQAQKNADGLTFTFGSSGDAANKKASLKFGAYGYWGPNVDSKTTLTMGCRMKRSASYNAPLVTIMATDSYVTQKWLPIYSTAATDVYVEVVVKDIDGRASNIKVYADGVLVSSADYQVVYQIYFGCYYEQIWTGHQLEYPTAAPTGSTISFNDVYITGNNEGIEERHGVVTVTSQPMTASSEGSPAAYSEPAIILPASKPTNGIGQASLALTWAGSAPANCIGGYFGCPCVYTTTPYNASLRLGTDTPVTFTQIGQSPWAGVGVGIPAVGNSHEFTITPVKRV